MPCCPNPIYKPLILDCDGNIRPLRANESIRADITGSGGLVTPGTTDNAVVRADGVTNDTIQGSDVIIDDNGRIGLGVSSPLAIIDGEGTSGATELRLTRVSADTGSPRIRYRKARGTPGSEAVVADGDIIGTFTFNTYRNGAYQGSDTPASCMFFAEVSGTPVGDSVPGDIVFNTTDVGQTANSNAMRISHEAGVFIYTSPGDTTPTDLPANAAGFFARDAANTQMFGMEEDGTVWQLTGSGMSDSSSQYEVPAVLSLKDTSAPVAPTSAVNVYSVTEDLWAQCDNVAVGTTHTLTTSTFSGILSGELHSITLTCANVTICGGDTNDIEDSTNSTICGGGTNTIDSSNNATVAGGVNHTINLSAASTIVGGSTCSITDATGSTVGGGWTCIIDDSDYSTILGGFENNITSTVANDSIYCSIGGGRDNDIVDSSHCFIGAGVTNVITGDCNYSVICGGQSNGTSGGGSHNFIGGGQSNDILTGGDWGVIGGGLNNQIEDAAFRCTIGGGSANVISGTTTAPSISTIAGGAACTITDSARATIGGGDTNAIDDSQYATISGGRANSIIDTNQDSDYSTIGGGQSNLIDDSLFATIAGGFGNEISGGAVQDSDRSTIGGGHSNTISDSIRAVIAGGQGNTIDTESDYGMIGSGLTNTINGSIYATICGGTLNTVSTGSDGGTILGGNSNECDADYSTVMGIEGNTRQYGEFAQSSGHFSAAGDAQAITFITRRATTDATATQMLLDGTSTAVTMPDNSCWMVEASVAAMRDDGTEAAGYLISACFRKDGAANPAVVGTINHHTTEEVTTGWDATMSVSGANVRIVVTGEAAKNINWVAVWRITQVIGS